VADAELVNRVRVALNLRTRKQAEHTLNAVIAAIEETLVAHQHEDGYQLRLGSLCRCLIRHRPALHRKAGFSGELTVPAKRKVKFRVLGELKKRETVA